MRIAHITATFPPYQGGTGNVCANNARELARRGHDVTVITAAAAGAPAEERWEGVRVRRLRPLARVGNAPLLPGLLAALRGFEIVHLHYPFFGAELMTAAACRSGPPLVITYHQDVLLTGAAGVIASGLTATLGRLVLRTAERVLFTSLDYGDASHIRPVLRGREHHIDELPNGVDVRHFHPDHDPAVLRARLGLGAEDRVALLVAGLDRAHYFKGVAVFLEALAGLEPSTHGIIVGDGDLRQSYEEQARALGLSRRIHFTGRVAVAELPLYYCLADMTVLPSTTMGEAFGLVLVEAMASERPVIASDLPGVRTVVGHGQNGLLVPPGASDTLARAIRFLADEPAMAAAYGRQGRAKALERYDWRQIGARLEQIYHDVRAARRTDLARRGLTAGRSPAVRSGPGNS